MLHQGAEAWNLWRSQYPDVRPELSDANLANAKLAEFELHDADLRRAQLSHASLARANLVNADLLHADLRFCSCTGANLTGAQLGWARFSGADLSFADFCGAFLTSTNLSHVILNHADLAGAELLDVAFINIDLSRVTGLEGCRHRGPSAVDQRTILRSRNVPANFWRGCGLSDQLIDYAPSLGDQAIQFFSCFISYSSKDQGFADRLHADLQNAGVRCWFAPHDLPIGAKILDGIDDAIRMRDKVVLILSKNAIASDWVEDEVTTAFEEERRRDEVMLVPLRLDDTVMNTDEAWAGKLRARNIGDFTKWKDHDAYNATLDRVLRDLKAG